MKGVAPIENKKNNKMSSDMGGISTWSNSKIINDHLCYNSLAVHRPMAYLESHNELTN